MCLSFTHSKLQQPCCDSRCCHHGRTCLAVDVPKEGLSRQASNPCRVHTICMLLTATTALAGTCGVPSQAMHCMGLTTSFPGGCSAPELHNNTYFYPVLWPMTVFCKMSHGPGWVPQLPATTIIGRSCLYPPIALPGLLVHGHVLPSRHHCVCWLAITLTSYQQKQTDKQCPINYSNPPTHIQTITPNTTRQYPLPGLTTD